MSRIKPFAIPNITTSLKYDYEEGRITLDDAAIELCKSGFLPYVDLERTKSILEQADNGPVKFKSLTKFLRLLDSCEDGPDRYQEFLARVANEDNITVDQLERYVEPYI